MLLKVNEHKFPQNISVCSLVHHIEVPSLSIEGDAGQEGSSRGWRSRSS
jgi:hypothetical protein